ncbi:MAG: terminase family protein [Pacificimonas sp.]|nr:terminase family protein [Pacificimonas sp.]
MWALRARGRQVWPEGDAHIWLMLAGRGFGKTRAGAEWVRTIAETVVDARIALVAATLDEARRVMVEGESGLLNIGDPEFRPRYYPARRLLKWPATGACAILYSAETPDGLRGPEHHAAWGDELAKWGEGEAALANLRMGLRLGTRPRLLLTTTPKPVPVLKALLGDPEVAVTRGSTRENLALPDSFQRQMQRAYGGTRLGRQELDGELIEDLPGGLWTRAGLERCRVRAAPEDLARVVVGVDPPAGGPDGVCGIVAAGLAADGRAYVLGDRSVAATSDRWARVVAETAEAFAADRVVAEKNNGGDMVRTVLRAGGLGLEPKLVHASRGKAARAEPVAGYYDAGRVHHVGALPDLEDQLCGLICGGGYEGPGVSPDRADALVWALTELLIKEHGGVPRVRMV